MRIGVLGTGMVGRTIATKLVDLGHEVRMGSREAANENAAQWVRAAGARATSGTFATQRSSASSCSTARRERRRSTRSSKRDETRSPIGSVLLRCVVAEVDDEARGVV